MKKILIIICITLVLGIITTTIYLNTLPSEMVVHGLLPELSQEEIILNSNIIVKGTVSSIDDSRWSNPEKLPSKRNVLQTDINIKISELIFGEYTSQTVVVRIDKGFDKKKNVRVVSDGYPDFSIGENVVLFLSRDDSDIKTNEDYFVLTGMRQGKWTINQNGSITADRYGILKNMDELKIKVEEENAKNPDWKERQIARNKQIQEENKKLFGE